jgi:hypothetical protein
MFVAKANQWSGLFLRVPQRTFARGLNTESIQPSLGFERRRYCPPSSVHAKSFSKPLIHASDLGKKKADVAPTISNPFASSNVRLSRRYYNRVSVELAPAHDVTRAGIEWIIFPEGKITATPKDFSDKFQRLTPLARHDVMEDSVTKNNPEPRTPNWLLLHSRFTPPKGLSWKDLKLESTRANHPLPI